MELVCINYDQYIRHFDNGYHKYGLFHYFKENGKFLALDLGGTNFRVILLELDNGTITNEVVKMYQIGSELRVGNEDVAIALFDHIGQCLCDFVEENDLVSVPLPLGEFIRFYWWHRMLFDFITFPYSSFYIYAIRIHILVSNASTQLKLSYARCMGKII